MKADVWGLFVGFFVEVLLTFVFVIAILGVTDKRYHDGKHAGIVIGLVLALVHMFGLGFTGTSVNPARSLAPAVLQAFAGNTTSLSQVWIWILAPLAGAALAAVVYGVLTKGKEEAAQA
jgi:aquaporin Z